MSQVDKRESTSTKLEHDRIERTLANKRMLFRRATWRELYGKSLGDFVLPERLGLFEYWGFHPTAERLAVLEDKRGSKDPSQLFLLSRNKRTLRVEANDHSGNGSVSFSPSGDYLIINGASSGKVYRFGDGITVFIHTEKLFWDYSKPQTVVSIGRLNEAARAYRRFNRDVENGNESELTEGEYQKILLGSASRLILKAQQYFSSLPVSERTVPRLDGYSGEDLVISRDRRHLYGALLAQNVQGGTGPPIKVHVWSASDGRKRATLDMKYGLWDEFPKFFGDGRYLAFVHATKGLTVLDLQTYSELDDTGIDSSLGNEFKTTADDSTIVTSEGKFSPTSR
jgi:hypothetical protein